MRNTRQVTFKSNDADKVQLRFQTTYSWAFTVEYQELNQILKGCQQNITTGGFTTGVSQNDKDAIRQALKERLKIDLKEFNGCRNCQTEMKIEPNMFYWRGKYLSGLVCEKCNALYDNPKDSFQEYVKNNP